MNHVNIIIFFLREEKEVNNIQKRNRDLHELEFIFFSPADLSQAWHSFLDKEGLETTILPLIWCPLILITVGNS